MDLLQLIVNGVALGAAYALVALGFVLILKATSAVNFAQGDMVMAGGFTAVAVAAAKHLKGKSRRWRFMPFTDDCRSIAERLQVMG